MTVIKAYILIITLLFSSLFAEEKAEKLKSDVTVSFNERKAVFSFPHIGSDSMFISIPVYDCVKECREVNSWVYQLSDEMLYQLYEDNVETLVGKRFDKIDKRGEELYISTAGGELSVPHLGREFQLGRVGFDHHKTRVSRYINKHHFKDSISQLLKKSMKSRVSSSKNSEKSSVNQSGKSLTITPDIQSRVLNSSYLFALYIDDIRGEFEIDSPDKGEYSLELQLDVDLKLAIYHYNYTTESYELYGEVEGSSSMFNPTVGGIGEFIVEQIFGGSKSRPTKRDGFRKFHTELQNSFESALKDLVNNLKKDREFMVQAPIENRSWRKATFNMGSGEDLRVDSTVGVFRFNDENEPVGIGWTKVRRVGNTDLNSKHRTLSSAEIINDSKSIEAFDLAIEYPWEGTLLSLYYGMADRSLNYKGSELGVESLSEVGVEYSIDLGYLFNFSPFSELWLNIGGSFSSSDFSETTQNFSISAEQSYSYGVGLDYRFYLFSPLYISAGFQYGEGVSDYTMSYSNSYRYYGERTNSVDMKIKGSFIEPQLKIGYSFTPNLELFVKANYRSYLSSENRLYDGDDEVSLDYIDDIASETFERDDHLKLLFGISLNSDVFDNIYNLESWSE